MLLQRDGDARQFTYILIPTFSDLSAAVLQIRRLRDQLS